MAAQLFGDRFHFPGRDTLDVDLRQSRNQGLLTSLITLKQLWRKVPLPILGDSQLKFTHPG